MSFDVDMNKFVALQEENHALEQENARLRKALEWVASNEVDPLDRNRRAQLEAAIRRARAALAEPKETEYARPPRED